MFTRPDEELGAQIGPLVHDPVHLLAHGVSEADLAPVVEPFGHMARELSQTPVEPHAEVRVGFPIHLLRFERPVVDTGV